MRTMRARLHRYSYVVLTGCCAIATSLQDAALSLSSAYRKVRLRPYRMLPCSRSVHAEACRELRHARTGRYQFLAAASFYQRIRTSISILTVLIILSFLAGTTTPFAAEPEVAGAALSPFQPIMQKIERWDAEAAWTEVKPLLIKEPKNVELLQLASEIAFFRGDYEEALKLARSALDLGGEEEGRKGFALLVESTLGVLKSYKRYETAHFVIMLDEKQDGILIDYLTDTLEKTYQLIGERYHFRPEEKVRVELFADTKAFYYASTLSARDIEVTGAVGLCKFNKLMFLSPRALVHGYRWLDAISHEYMHYMITKLTANMAPIWFHEGLAEHEETLWRGEPPQLSPAHQALIARALADGRLISFEQMDPGLVKLKTPEDVQLAYAEAESAIAFIIEKKGHAGLQEVMKQMAASGEKGASSAIKTVMGWDFNEFEGNWKEFLASQGYKEVDGISVHRYKLKEGLADDDRMEMREIKSMIARNRAHLGDLLQEKGRLEAAVLEYRRALEDARDSVPVLNRLSEALISLDKIDDALEHLNRARKLAPDHPNTYASLGKIYLKRKDPKKAQEALEDAIQINPFNPDIHKDLATAYDMLGRSESALKEREIFNKLKK
jgi:tetratricopeptide (TPR) repeat protein